MNFQCKNCGGNMVFAPASQNMYCPYCDGENCESIDGNDSLTVCASCGGELTIGEFTSASRCPYCNNYLVFDKRVEGQYRPDTIIPFKLNKDMAVKAIEKEFKKRTFAPISFLSEKSLEDMAGYYVPFFLYDYHADGVYDGEGTKVRKWTSGNYDYTETSYYHIRREMSVEYDNIPVDASTDMDDKTMDLIEPYDYAQLTSFDPKYMSGFFGEVYNNTAEAYEERAKVKAVESAATILHQSISDYTFTSHTVDTTTLTGKDVDFALFPVWVYKYSWAGREFPFFINGQTGKVIGKTPISKLKVLLYSATLGGVIAIGIKLALMILEVF